MGDFDAYVASVEQEVRRLRAEPEGPGTFEGELEGLTSEGLARLQPTEGEGQHHHAGFLLGHLIRWLHERGWPVGPRLLVAACYGAAVATLEGQAALVREDGVMRVHVYAALTAERRMSSPLSEPEERMVYAWLCEQAGLPVTARMVERLEWLRAKRHATSRPLG